MANRISVPLVVLSLLLSACGAPKVSLTSTTIPSISPSPSLSATTTPKPTLSPTTTPEPSATPVPTATTTLAPTETLTPIPTYVKLRGEVIIDQAICHYGPGAPYLYKYGVYKGSNLEIIRRLEGGNYVEIQAIGGDNPCWVRVDYFEIKGSVQDVQPVSIDDIKLPISPYYTSPGGVSARRDGNEVTVFWNPLILRAGDDSEQMPYIIEAWVCQNQQMVFVPAGSYQPGVKINDEPGCATPSHAWFIAAEKHGYTGRAAVPWPSAETDPAARPTRTP